MTKFDRSGSQQRRGHSMAERRYGSQMRMNLKDAAVTLDQRSVEAPQDISNKRGPDYDNRTPRNWLVGANEDATTKPGFDHSPSRDKMRR